MMIMPYYFMNYFSKRSFSVHHCNIQFLAIEIYKIINGLSNYNLENLIRNTSAYNPSSAQDFILPQLIQYYGGKTLLNILVHSFGIS